MKTGQPRKVSKDLRRKVEEAIHSILLDDLEPTTRAIRGRMKSTGGVSISQPLLLEAARSWREKHTRPARDAAMEFHHFDSIQRREFYRALREWKKGGN
jgi:hypothetical protein